jgi:hypothetical protein
MKIKNIIKHLIWKASYTPSSARCLSSLIIKHLNADKVKPWDDKHSFLSQVWWKYAKLTKFKFVKQKSKSEFWKKVKYKNGKKVTRYFGGIIKKVKGEKSKKIYLFGVQIFHKKYL